MTIVGGVPARPIGERGTNALDNEQDYLLGSVFNKYYNAND
jgi:hypothetical protein